MFRWFFSFTILMLVVLGLGYFLMAYQVVRTDDGYSVIEKKDWEFTAPVLDVRDWDLADYARNFEISKALAKEKLNKLKNFAKESWNDLTEQLDDLDKDDWDKATKEVQEKYEDIKKETRRRYDQLVEKWEKEEIDLEQFKAQVKRLKDWTAEKINEIRGEPK